MRRILSTLIISFLIFPFTGAAQGEQRYADGTANDQENNSFEWINYGTQDWSIENAKMETYRDGTPIPRVTDASGWENLTTGAWCYINNDPTKGKLYNWYAIAGIHDSASLSDASQRKELAPEGWRVPTDDEWSAFEIHLITNGYNNNIAKAMASTSEWRSSTGVETPGNNQSLNNTSGFNAFPEGNRYNSGAFEVEGYYAVFWSSTENSTGYAWYRYLANNSSVLIRDSYGKRDGFSVRFVRDSSSNGPSDILLNGTVSAENNQIKNVADPTDAQDAATKGYVDSNVNSFSGSYNDLTDKPTSFSGDLSGNVTSNFLKLNPLTQAEIDNLNPEAGTIVFNADSEKFIGYSGSAGQELDQSQENQNQLVNNYNTAQSFTAGSSGSLLKIDVKLSNGEYGQPDNNVTLTLREGEGTDGNVLFSTGLSTSSLTAEWISVDISGVEITQGSKYTIHLTSSSFSLDVFKWARDNTNPYPNGKSFYNNTAYTDYDLCFKTYITTTGWVDLN